MALRGPVRLAEPLPGFFYHYMITWAGGVTWDISEAMDKTLERLIEEGPVSVAVDEPAKFHRALTRRGLAAWKVTEDERIEFAASPAALIANRRAPVTPAGEGWQYGSCPKEGYVTSLGVCLKEPPYYTGTETSIIGYGHDPNRLAEYDDQMPARKTSNVVVAVVATLVGILLIVLYVGL